ncbi:uncharacterized protein Gasu_47550 [Galdieria sulphuraria]|uniref:Uncharacterized protein n=1 Tax=Galdieria sulphuraria TaxID=130081 RepID=M2XWG1_GALSU|nr:uncharacterized protein Gasu_47550 [Galdieria sulphuraria]EME27769.1 hypothetical protein Gasu_47550 [Galdieria sulphuraria]|eukprot:XP_005704289.1 hypothetical protein Gasu_47550 [Galdieria sulphuraria]
MALCFCSVCAFSNKGLSSSVYRPFGYTSKTSSLKTSQLCRNVTKKVTLFQMKTSSGNKTTVKNVNTEQQLDSELNGEKPVENDVSSSEEQTSKWVYPSRRYGATIDMDGKSNVWAVEPKVVVQSEDETSKGNWIPLIIGIIVVLIAAALPFLPLTNADQFR